MENVWFSTLSALVFMGIPSYIKCLFDEFQLILIQFSVGVMNEVIVSFEDFYLFLLFFGAHLKEILGYTHEINKKY